MGTDGLELGDVSLLDGEHVDSTLDLKNGLREYASGGSGVVLLTDKRVIHVFADGRRERADFASLGEIESAEILSEKVGKSAYVWGVLAILAALMLSQVIDRPVRSITAATAVGLMGVYLIVDKIRAPATSVVVFKGSSSQFQVSLKSDRATADAYTFINRLHALKELDEREKNSGSPDEIFPPC